MKIKELNTKKLMVGDWVFHPSIIPSSNKPLQILEILVDRVRLIDGVNRGSAFLENLEYIRPIPLTPDVFEKNGFEEKILEPKSRWREFYLCDGILIWEVPYDGWVIGSNSDDYDGWFRIHYVHELQHALNMFNIDIDIKL